MNRPVFETKEAYWSAELFKFAKSSGAYWEPQAKGNLPKLIIPYYIYSIYYDIYENATKYPVSDLILQAIVSKINLIERSYHLIDKENIFAFLNKNPNYDDILIEIRNIIGDYFQDDIALSLELLEEFEEPESPKLRITIRSDMELLEANKQLKNFRINWFFQNYEPNKTRIMFTLGIL